MKNQSKTDTLIEKIRLLQSKKEREFTLLKEQFHVTYESLKPINLIKNTFHEVTESSEIKNNIVNNTIGLATGYLTKKVLFGSARYPIAKLVGTLLQFAIANIVSKHTDNIKSIGENLLLRFLKHRKESKKHFQNKGNDLFI